MLDRLEKSKFLRRRRVDEDGRSFQVYLTDKGKRQARECDEVAVIYEKSLLLRITVREQQMLHAVLKKMLDVSEQSVHLESEACSMKSDRVVPTRNRTQKMVAERVDA
jgi:DNA-binding PadR family transcriptional regulator